MPTMPPSGTRPPLGTPRIVGRDQELAVLVGQLGMPGSVSVVHGEAGVGKSRLVSEAVRLYGESSLLVAVAACSPVREPLPLAPVLRCVAHLGHRLADAEMSPLVGALRPLLPELTFLPEALPQLGDPSAERLREFRALVEVLTTASDTLLVIEDVQWSDDSTRDFLGFLVHDMPAALRVVLTVRTGEGAPLAIPRAMHVELAPLDQDAVCEMVASMLGETSLSSEFARYLHESTDGIPFVVEELVRWLADRRDLVHTPAGWSRRVLRDLPVPAGLRGYVVDRLERLTPQARRVVEAAAVLGDPVDEHALRLVAGIGLSDFADGLTTAVQSDVIRARADGRFSVRHRLATHVVLDCLDVRTARTMHGRAAAFFAASDDVASVGRAAFHYRHAGRLAEHSLLSEQAGDIARSLGGDGAAVEFYLDSLQVCARRDVRDRRTVKLARVVRDARAWDDQVDDAIRAVLEDAATAPDVRAELRVLVACRLTDEDHFAEAASVLDATDYPGDRPDLTANRLIYSAVHQLTLGDAYQMRDIVGQALRAAEACEPAARLPAELSGLWLLYVVGDPDATRRTGELLADPPDDPRESVRLASNVAITAIRRGDVAKACAAHDLVVRRAGPLGYGRVAAMLASLPMLIALAKGEWESVPGDAERLAREWTDPAVIRDVELALATVALGAGALDEAEERFARCMSDPSLGTHPDVVAAVSGRSRVALERGRPEVALDVGWDVCGKIVAAGWTAWAGDLVTCMVDALLASGDVPGAAALTERFAAAYGVSTGPGSYAALKAARGAVLAAQGDYDAAATLFAASAGTMRTVLALRAATGYAERQAAALQLANRPEWATVAAQCLAEYERSGATADADRVRCLLRQSGIDARKRGGRRSYGSDLSPRENDVVRLAATGLSNREIAERLHLSARTVEHHVERALRKLGLRSRRDLHAPDVHTT